MPSVTQRYEGVDASDDWTSDPFQAQWFTTGRVIGIVSGGGSALGELRVLVSNQPPKDYTRDQSYPPATDSFVTAGAVAVNGDGTVSAEVPITARWVKLQYARTSGSGDIDVQFQAFGPAR